MKMHRKVYAPKTSHETKRVARVNEEANTDSAWFIYVKKESSLRLNSHKHLALSGKAKNKRDSIATFEHFENRPD